MTAFDNIRLEKGLYASGDFTGALEKIDPSENYSGTALEGLDAYQRQLKRFDIKVSGAGSDVVDKFFKTSDSAVLFPEYVSRAVRQGMQEANVLPRIVASTTVIDSLDYRSIACEPSDDEKELKVVAEGAFIPETSVKSKANLVHLKKLRPFCLSLPMKPSASSALICSQSPCARSAHISRALSSAMRSMCS